ncbi:ATP-binding protein [Kribbella ginsengisoli]|uniref:HTH cro/C1-type domain-containing protein n=1 Tax=Kribbella ginsengisoli TaxID=363865 RepID=A0ABP6WSY5_9ACTN
MQPAEGEFRELLRAYRQRAGLTQEELAERAGLSVDAIGLLERGERRRPQRQTLTALAAALHLTPTDREDLERARQGELITRSPGTPGERRPLPIPPNPLLGRTTEVASAITLLADSSVRLLTIVGPGGVGKTRLALEIASQFAGGAALSPDGELVAGAPADGEDSAAPARPTDVPGRAGLVFGGGVVFVGLGDLREVGQVGVEVVRSLGVKERGGTDPVARAVEAIGGSAMLLVVDNFEHLVAGAGVVAELLAACPRLRVLATSRTPLRVSGERVFPLRPLDVPEELSAGELLTLPAVEIFARRALAVVPGFAVSAGNSGTVAAICRKVDGLPLAIELAAPWVRVLSEQELLEQLGKLELLADGPRDLPERHQALRNTLAWSNQLLTASQQRALAALSVFVGGFSTEAAIAVTGASVRDLAALVDSSLVTPDGERFRLLEMVRQYADEQLQPADREAVLAKYDAYFFELTARAEMVGPDETRWKLRLAADDANVDAAVGHVVATGDPQRSIQFVRQLWRYWTWHGRLATADHWLAAVRGLLDDSVDLLIKAKLLLWSATTARLRGEYDQAEQFFLASAELATQAGDLNTANAATHNLGIVYYDLGRYDEAAEYFRTTVTKAAHMDSRYGLAFGLTSVGDVERRRGDSAAAGAAYRQGLEIFREIDHDRGIAQALLGLAHLAADDGRTSEAGDQFIEAARLTEGLQDPLAADCLDGLARHYTAIGNHPAATDATTAATTLRHRIGAQSHVSP